MFLNPKIFGKKLVLCRFLKIPYFRKLNFSGLAKLYDFWASRVAGPRMFFTPFGTHLIKASALTNLRPVHIPLLHTLFFYSFFKIMFHNPKKEQVGLVTVRLVMLIMIWPKIICLCFLFWHFSWYFQSCKNVPTVPTC